MKPLPEEVLADLRWTLDNVIRPTLEDSYAAEQATLMSSLLEHLRLRTLLEFDLLQQDCADIRTTLDTGSLPPDLRRALGAVRDHTDAVKMETLRADGNRLRELLREALIHFESLAEEGDDEAVAALERIRPLLRRQLDRERQLIGPGYALGT